MQSYRPSKKLFIESLNDISKRANNEHQIVIKEAIKLISEDDEFYVGMVNKLCKRTNIAHKEISNVITECKNALKLLDMRIYEIGDMLDSEWSC
jgi:hypothetical protein